MKTKLLAVLATLGMVASASAVKINNNLSINGFIDGSWSSTDTDGAGNTNDEQAMGIDEVELNFIVNAGSVSGEIHLDNANNARTQGTDDFEIEQAHFTYSFSNGLTAQVGRFGSALGLEREDPAGLYTFSRAYDAVAVGGIGDAFNIGNIDQGDYRADGVRLGYNLDSVSFSLAAVNPVGAVEETNVGGAAEDNLDYEFAVSFNALENLTLGAGIIQINNREAGAPADDITITNITASYTINKILLLAEYVNADEDNNEDLSAYAIIADYDFNDKFGIAVRYSEWEESATVENDKLTIAPNYAITNSLGAILEYSATDDGNNDQDQLALELTYTF
jgi:hypothetical protein